MPRETDLESLDRERIRRIAAEVAERIGAGSGARLELNSGRRVCPPNRLCCWGGYSCPPPFYSDDYFGCIDRFTGIFEGGASPGARSNQR